MEYKLNSQHPHLTPSEQKAVKTLIDCGCKTIQRVSESVMQSVGNSIDSNFEEFEMRINLPIVRFFPDPDTCLSWLTTEPINLKELLEERTEK